MLHLVIAIIILLSLILSGMWIAVAIGVSGIYALLFKIGAMRTLDVIGLQAWWASANFVLTCVPLFVFMGEFLSASGIINRVYKGLGRTVAGIPGELQQTNIAACAVFAAASGSSLAGSATMGKIAYEELVHGRRYDKRLTMGTIAAGGTLGILIPPSIIMIIYAVTVEESIGQLFVAGIIPGLSLTALFMLYVAIRALSNPNLMPRELVHVNLRERLGGMFSIWPFLLLMTVVLGSIYMGLATPTEAAAAGATGAILIAMVYHSLTWENLFKSATETVRTTSMIFLIVMCARLLGMAMGYYGVSNLISQWVLGIGSPTTIYLLVMLIYLILGCFFDSITIIVLTVPLILPGIEGLGFSKLWFGIVVTVLIEAGLLTPPVGVNLFIMQGVTGESLEEIAKGAAPFVVMMVILLVAIYIWPSMVTWLPGLLYG